MFKGENWFWPQYIWVKRWKKSLSAAGWQMLEIAKHSFQNIFTLRSWKNDHQVLFAFRYCLVLLNMKIKCRRYDIWCCTFCSEMSPLKYVFLFALVHLQLLWISRSTSFARKDIKYFALYSVNHFPTFVHICISPHLYFDLILCQWKMFSQLFLASWESPNTQQNLSQWGEPLKSH